ncbi:MAG: cyclic nucleotide-binding domain-containing protein [Clostridia bacterium]|nr:cyclic nucleotide-binding domain-containing protein [Clostridia bacterium]
MFKEFGHMTEKSFVETFQPGEKIISSSQPLIYLRYLIKGKAKITLVHEDGKESIVDFVQPKEYLGELTFLDIEDLHKNVDAISPCTFRTLAMKDADELKNDPIFLYALGQTVGKKLLHRTHFYLKNQNYEFKKRRCAYMLVSQHDSLYKEKHVETAAYLGVSYRHLLFTFKCLLDEGLIEKVSKGYKLNLDALTKKLKVLTMNDIFNEDLKDF